MLGDQRLHKEEKGWRLALAARVWEGGMATADRTRRSCCNSLPKPAGE